LGRSIHIISENTGALIVVSKEIGLEVNADKMKYMVMSQDQNAGQSHNIGIDNSSFERVEEFKYLESTILDQNSIQLEIRSRLMLENASYHSAQNLLPSNLVSKNKHTKI
jgi:hypothetical protein